MENGSIAYVAELRTEDDVWDVIRTLQNNILSANDLFISTPPTSVNNQSKVCFLWIFDLKDDVVGNGSFSSYRDSSASPGKLKIFFLHSSIRLICR